MSKTYIPVALRRLIKERANGQCEYCLIHDDDVFLPHEPDHIIAEQHGGETTDKNLALACIHCNRQKGPNIASLDLATNLIIPLFNPRTDVWDEHFVLEGAYIRALTPIGRATARLLKLNHSERLRIRQVLLATGRYP